MSFCKCIQRVVVALLQSDSQIIVGGKEAIAFCTSRGGLSVAMFDFKCVYIYIWMCNVSKPRSTRTLTPFPPSASVQATTKRPSLSVTDSAMAQVTLPPRPHLGPYHNCRYHWLGHNWTGVISHFSLHSFVQIVTLKSPYWLSLKFPP